MAAIGVGTGHPDGEVRAMPHGAALLSGAGLAVAAGGTNLPGISGFIEVAAYRSLVIQIANTGAFDVTVTPRWNFYDSNLSTGSTDVQTVPAGTTKRLLFQSQGEIIDRIRLAGVGGATTVTYYVTGSNLDPFSSGVREILTMIQRTPIQAIPNNVGTFVEYGPDPATRFYTNESSDWSFDTTGAGDITAVHMLKPGLYHVHAHFTFSNPGNYNKELNLLVGSLEPYPPLTQTTTDRKFDTFADSLECNYVLALSASSAGAANNAIRTSVLQVSGGAVNVDAALLQVVRLGSLFP